MLDFIYDSLDTVKKLKFPTIKQIAQLTGAIFALVLIAGLYFVLADTLFADGYRVFYGAMTDGKPVAASVNTNTEESSEELNTSTETDQQDPSDSSQGTIDHPEEETTHAETE